MRMVSFSLKNNKNDQSYRLFVLQSIQRDILYEWWKLSHNSDGSNLFPSDSELYDSLLFDFLGGGRSFSDGRRISSDRF